MKKTSSYRSSSGRNGGDPRYKENSGEYRNDAYRRNRGDNSRTFPEDSNYDNTYHRNNRAGYEQDSDSYDRRYLLSDNYDAPDWNPYTGERSSYNTDTHRDPDAYSYRSSGDYRKENDYDTDRYPNENSRTDRRRDDLNHGSRWEEDTRHRSSRHFYDSSQRHGIRSGSGAREDSYNGRYRDNRDYDNPGYNGRNASDYGKDYDTGHYYDPSDHYNRGDSKGYTYRHDEDYERELRNPGPKGYYSWGRENEDRSGRNYGYYESYPSYGQSESLSDHERYTGKTSGRSRTDRYGETEYEDRRNQNVRDR